MKTYTFKTNLKCSGCVSGLMPFMNELKEVQKWDVDLGSEKKILSVSADDSLEVKDIIATVAKAGYKAEII
ncbi:MAG: heavy-metal-associated domain-containing protein [Bacteroidetes bacterium]|nr:heavy-metal-associated domain-containing protein [Bacteroidota bacterium]